MKQRLFILACFDILVLQNLYGQSITGRILLEGAPASFATIQSQTSRNIIADENGFFSLPADTGMIRLNIRYAGALPLDTMIRCSGIPCLAEIHLRADMCLLHEVVISGGWKETERSSSPVSTEDSNIQNTQNTNHS